MHCGACRTGGNRTRATTEPQVATGEPDDPRIDDPRIDYSHVREASPGAALIACRADGARYGLRRRRCMAARVGQTCSSRDGFLRLVMHGGPRHCRNLHIAWVRHDPLGQAMLTGRRTRAPRRSAPIVVRHVAPVVSALQAFWGPLSRRISLMHADEDLTLVTCFFHV